MQALLAAPETVVEVRVTLALLESLQSLLLKSESDTFEEYGTQELDALEVVAQRLVDASRGGVTRARAKDFLRQHNLGGELESTEFEGIFAHMQTALEETL